VRGAGAFNTVPVRVEVIQRESLTPIVTGRTVQVELDQDWTPIAEQFLADGSEVVVRLSLLGQAGGANVNVDDISVDCR
jgi:hypothetical protein